MGEQPSENAALFLCNCDEGEDNSMSQGGDIAKVTIPTDEDGMLGCQCPREECRPRYFKIEVASSEDDADESAKADEGTHESSDEEHQLYCPYCGRQDDRQRFFTPDQIAFATSLIFRYLADLFQRELKKVERRPDPHAFISIGITVTTNALPAIATYEENHLKQQVICPHCQTRYAIYGISFTCPRCGGDTLLWHLESTAQEIRVFLDLPEDILMRLDTRSQEKIVENALEDVVSFWEGYLKALYIHAIRHRYPSDNVEQLERQIGTTFQRVQGANERYARDLGIDLLASISPDDLEVLSRTFNKRHVLTHNLGMVDEKFLAQTHAGQQVGQEIEVSKRETLQALDIVHRVLRRADELVR
jgi:Zn finger protein HypA/HybF involved in hydrogenase expression